MPEPDFNNLRTALLRQGEPLRVPQFELSIDADVKGRFLGRPAASLQDEVDFFIGAGYDFVPVSIGLRQVMRGEGERGLDGSRRGAKDPGAGLESALKPLATRYNPEGNGPRTRLWAEEGRGLIQDETGLDAFDWPHPDHFHYDAVERLGKLLPSGAKLVVNVGCIFTAAWMLMGMEAFCIALGEGSAVVARLIRRIGEIQARVVEHLLGFECVGAIAMPDDLAHSGGLMVHPRVLREHVFPWDRRIGERVHARGLPYIYHSDGKLHGVIEDLIECGFDALHPCERSSMDIVQVKRRHGGHLCVCGNIDLDSTLTLGTPVEVEEEVKERIRTLGPGGGYCCGSSNSVPEYVPYPNYIAMIEAVQKHGRYPISV